MSFFFYLNYKPTGPREIVINGREVDYALREIEKMAKRDSTSLSKMSQKRKIKRDG